MLNFYEYVEKIISISNISEVGGGDRSTGNRWCQIMHRRELVIIIMVMNIMIMHRRKHHHAEAWCVCISICISHEKEEGSYWLCLNKHSSSLKHPILLFLWHSGKHWHIGWLPLISSAHGIALQKIEYCTNEHYSIPKEAAVFFWTLVNDISQDEAYWWWTIWGDEGWSTCALVLVMHTQLCAKTWSWWWCWRWWWWWCWWWWCWWWRCHRDDDGGDEAGWKKRQATTNLQRMTKSMC